MNAATVKRAKTKTDNHLKQTESGNCKTHAKPVEIKRE
jgi:hypothetical protein